MENQNRKKSNNESEDEDNSYLNVDSGSIICNKCGKEFNFKLNLDRHISRTVHGEVKDYSIFCKKRFSRTYQLKRHIKVVHQGVKDKKFSCDICDKANVKMFTKIS